MGTILCFAGIKKAKAFRELYMSGPSDVQIECLLTNVLSKYKKGILSSEWLKNVLIVTI